MKIRKCRFCDTDLTNEINKQYCNLDCYLNHKHRASKQIIVENIDNMIQDFESGMSLLAIKRKYKISIDLVRNEFKKRNIISNFNRQFGKRSHFWTGYEGISGRYWTGIKASAKKRNLEFNLTIKEAWNQFIIQNQKCALSGIKLILEADKLSHTQRKTINASLDRIDSSKGYVKDNIQWVTKEIQIMKNRFYQEYFIEICKQIARYQGV